jgi:hypothetical protein
MEPADLPEISEEELHQFFLIRYDLDRLEKLLPENFKMLPELTSLYISFQSNLVSILALALAMWVFARRYGHNTAFASMLGVQIGLRTARGSAVSDEEMQAEVMKKVRESLDREELQQKTTELTDRIAREGLKQFAADKIGRDSAQNVLRQCTVLTWSAFEVVATDLFTCLLNNIPSLTSRLLKDEQCKRRFNNRDLMASLEEHDYDLSGRMGQVLLQQCRLDDLETIKCVFSAVFPQANALRETLQQKQFWGLYKTRNLIVHRSGVADATFVKSVAMDSNEIGKKIIVSAEKLEKLHRSCCEGGSSTHKSSRS